MKKRALLCSVFLTLILLPNPALGSVGDLEVMPGSLRFSVSRLTEGRKIRIYASIKNNATDDLYGTVKFFNKTLGGQIGPDQPISVIKQKTDDVFVDWTPASGKQVIRVDIIPWQKGDNAGNNSFSTEVDVEPDLDRDGIPDAIDPDIDGDGVPNSDDAFPFDPKEWKDTDGDGIGDNSDPDIDGDGVPNSDDAFPFDPKEWKDTDGDGIGDNSDAFPLDPKEWKDTNRNGIGDNRDPDIDGDGIPNASDPFPLNVAPVVIVNESEKPLIVAIGKPILFDAGPSYDTDGKIETVTWYLDPGTPKAKVYQGVRPKIVVDEAGNHEIEVVVRDNSGETKSKKWKLFGTASIFLTNGGIMGILIGLALFAGLYYTARAFRKKRPQS